MAQAARAQEPIRVAEKFMRFAAVGVIGTLAHYLTLVIIVEAADARPLLGSSIGFIVGAFVNYALNYRFTFDSRRRHREALPRFYLIATIGFLFNGTIFWMLTEPLAWHYLLAQLIATIIVLIWNFAGNLLWTFSEKRVASHE